MAARVRVCLYLSRSHSLRFTCFREGEVARAGEREEQWPPVTTRSTTTLLSSFFRSKRSQREIERVTVYDTVEGEGENEREKEEQLRRRGSAALGILARSETCSSSSESTLYGQIGIRWIYLYVHAPACEIQKGTPSHNEKRLVEKKTRNAWRFRFRSKQGRETKDDWFEYMPQEGSKIHALRVSEQLRRFSFIINNRLDRSERLGSDSRVFARWSYAVQYII